MDLRGTTRIVTGVATDGLGLMGKMMAWMLIVWFLPAMLLIAAFTGRVELAIAGAVYGVLGVLGWWICNGLLRRGRVRMVLAALGALALCGAVAFALVDPPPGQSPVAGLGMAILMVIAGVLLIVEAFSRREAS